MQNSTKYVFQISSPQKIVLIKWKTKKFRWHTQKWTSGAVIALGLGWVRHRHNLPIQKRIYHHTDPTIHIFPFGDTRCTKNVVLQWKTNLLGGPHQNVWCCNQTQNNIASNNRRNSQWNTRIGTKRRMHHTSTFRQMLTTHIFGTCSFTNSSMMGCGITSDLLPIYWPVLTHIPCNPVIGGGGPNSTWKIQKKTFPFNLRKNENLETQKATL